MRRVVHQRPSQTRSHLPPVPRTSPVHSSFARHRSTLFPRSSPILTQGRHHADSLPSRTSAISTALLLWQLSSLIQSWRRRISASLASRPTLSAAAPGREGSVRALLYLEQYSEAIFRRQTSSRGLRFRAAHHVAKSGGGRRGAPHRRLGIPDSEV